MKTALDHRFPLLNTGREKTLFIVMCTIFSFFFIYTFVPFNFNTWYDIGKLSLMNIIIAFSVSAALTLVFTQFCLRKWLHLKNFSYGQYFLWFIGEIMFLSVVMTFIDWLLNNHPAISVDYYLLTFKYTLLIAIIPYVIGLLILFAAQQYRLATNLSMKIKANVSALEALPIEDEKGKLILSLQPQNILFFKSEDNYVDVYYLIGSTVKRELIRTTLKKIEEKCQHNDLIRIHRSYTINARNISSSKKTAKGYIIQFDQVPELQIPVSASHQKQFEQYLSN
ncbi:LytR/AlgR family response regulator transcription factor [Pedobacter frigoris]|uniref:LytR/AlgR family response regulator transcription factor n=1 Tax=Pedobacter frigoris TaxID=2571272 RepID=UPI00292F473E|nr:LytTR family transcriptional regulator DNA-binding domain-containing protein [Pedobacter frigoris]